MARPLAATVPATPWPTGIRSAGSRWVRPWVASRTRAVRSGVSSSRLPALARRAWTAASSTTASSLGRSWVEERVSPRRFMERASSSRLDRRALRYSPSSTRMRSKARASSPISPPERMPVGGLAKSPLAIALAWAASSPRGRLTSRARTEPSRVATRQTTTSPSSTMASRRESIPAVVGVAGMLTSSRACSPTLEVSGSVDMTTWRPASLPRRVPSAAGTRSSAVRRPIVLATGVSPMTRVRSASRVPLARRWSSWLSIQMPAVTVPRRQRRDPAGEQPRGRRSALWRWSIGQLRTRCFGARSMPRGPGARRAGTRGWCGRPGRGPGGRGRSRPGAGRSRPGGGAPPAPGARPRPTWPRAGPGRGPGRPRPHGPARPGR